jgi:hypothetical protein
VGRAERVEMRKVCFDLIFLFRHCLDGTTYKFP